MSEMTSINEDRFVPFEEWLNTPVRLRRDGIYPVETASYPTAANGSRYHYRKKVT